MGKFTSIRSPTGDMASTGPNPSPPWSNVYDPEVSKGVINSQPILHLSFPAVEDEFFRYKQNPETIYVHGHRQEPIKSRLEEVGSLPVTIAASKIHSYVLGYSGFATGYTWVSTVVNGVAHPFPVSNEFKEERLAVMDYILDSLIPDRSTNIRDLGNDVDHVSIVRIDVNETESHTHSIPAALVFEMKKDVSDQTVRENYWEGAVPTWQAFGDPIAGEHNRVREAPDYLTKFIEDQNAENKKNAENAASAPWPYDPIGS
ncbi:hypothetical protein UA08_09057 [Talaromyces atroroseus]|uniref:Uncharacterized protein n=1 Tax=Talaromyces atroroseus TaxID=1441469 RepID=A0A1Q5Q775_TALAT|nr:hypothetical protein UA08_09057 [Talaromyces atroroseus]OKL55699.1 hypothetical protein UA08_09057 [Talaromyces atroroseus]